MAVADGKVVLKYYSNDFGHLVAVSHGDGVYTLYGHNSEILVEKGQEVKEGDIIASSGNTGKSTNPHVHFEIIIHEGELERSDIQNADRKDPKNENLGKMTIEEFVAQQEQSQKKKEQNTVELYEMVP